MIIQEKWAEIELLCGSILAFWSVIINRFYVPFSKKVRFDQVISTFEMVLAEFRELKFACKGTKFTTLLKLLDDLPASTDINSETLKVPLH